MAPSTHGDSQIQVPNIVLQDPLTIWPLFTKQDAEVSTEEIESDLIVWTAGSQPSSVLKSLDFKKDYRGRIEVNRRLQPVGTEGAGSGQAVGSAASGVYCLGDIAAVEGMDLPSNAQVSRFLVVMPLFGSKRSCRGHPRCIAGLFCF